MILPAQLNFPQPEGGEIPPEPLDTNQNFLLEFRKKEANYRTVREIQFQSP